MNTSRAVLQILNTSIVITANSHNPSILHPSFLTAEGIVPAKWQLAEPPICTPALSVVKYRNGVVFTVESNKFQVLHNVVSPSDVVRTLAARYVEKLPHVRYTAVGINITAMYECENAEQMVIERFVRHGPWNEGDLRLNSVGIRFVYSALGGMFRVSCDPGKITNLDRPDEKSGIVVAANYNYELDSSAPLKAALECISRYEQCVLHFPTATNLMFAASLNGRD